MEGGSLSGGQVSGGAGGTSGGNFAISGGAGQGFGAGIFLMGNQTLDLAPLAGQTLTIASQIADQTGSDPTDQYRDPGAGTLSVQGAGTAVLAVANNFTGGIQLGSGTLDLAASGAAGSGTITFESLASPLLEFSSADAPSNAIAGFGAGDTIEITGFLATGTTFVGNGLILSGVSGQVSLDVPGLNAAQISITPQTGADATEIVACYAAGTRIRTAQGDVAIESLAIGDSVLTVCGALCPIRWIGHRTVECRRHPRPHTMQPIRIEAHAFAVGQPARDLLLSPDHAVFLENVLIPIKHLQNGTTIRQIDVARMTYYHIELDRHDVVFAEGLPAETYLDTGNRGAFANNGIVDMVPDFADRTYFMWEALGYAPLMVRGETLDQLRRAG